jgi:hypothetical protein
MKKIAILGSKGYVGSNLASILSDSSSLTLFSHQSDLVFDGQCRDKNSVYKTLSILGFVNDFDLIVFLLESKEPKEKEQIYELFNSISHESIKTKIIFFSTFSIYSDWISPYTAFKRRIETASQSYKNIYVLRPGVIYGGHPGGLYKTFLRLSKSSFLVLPAADAITGYVHIQQVAKFVQKLSNSDKASKITPLVDIYIPLKEMLQLLKFKGLIVQLPVKFIKPFLSPLRRVSNYLPRSLHSLASLVAMQIPRDLELNDSQKLIMRKIIFSQFIRVNKIKEIKLNIRGFMRAIESSNSLNAYLILSKNEKYIFLKRLHEIYSLNVGIA